MAALIADLDGTVFSWGTNQFLPGAYEELCKFYAKGNELIFVTQRDNPRFMFLPDVENYLKTIFPHCVVIFGVSSPRILINDAGAMAINHPKDAPWTYELTGE